VAASPGRGHVDGGRFVLLKAARRDVVIPDVASALVYRPVPASTTWTAAQVDVRCVTVTCIDSGNSLTIQHLHSSDILVMKIILVIVIVSFCRFILVII